MASTKQYAWKDLRVVILGREVVGIQEIEYEPEFGKEYVYGRGANPLAIQSTNKSYKGKISLLQSEHTALIEAIKAINPAYDISDISFDVIAAYGNGTDSTTDIIRSIEVTGYVKNLSQGDANMVIEMNFMALDISEAVQ